MSVFANGRYCGMAYRSFRLLLWFPLGMWALRYYRRKRGGGFWMVIGPFEFGW